MVESNKYKYLWVHAYICTYSYKYVNRYEHTTYSAVHASNDQRDLEGTQVFDYVRICIWIFTNLFTSPSIALLFLFVLISNNCLASQVTVSLKHF